MPTWSRLRLRVFVCAALVISLAAPLAGLATAATPEEERLEATKAKIVAVRRQLESAEQRLSNDAAALRHAQRHLSVVTQALAAAENAVARQQQAVEQARDRLAELQERQAEQQELMAARAVSHYKSGAVSQLTTILGSESPRDVLRRTAYMEVVHRADTRSLEQVTITQTAVDAQRQQLRAEEEALRRVAEQQREIAAEAEALRNERALVLAASSRQVRQLQAQENHLEAESRELAAIARRAARQAAAARAAPTSTTSSSSGSSAPPPASGGGWTWPASGPVTSEYGYRWGRLHAGIDIGAPSGAPVYAARAGTVSYAGSMSGYGNLILLNHGGGITTAYAHQSGFSVGVGASVSAGQQIGYVGSTGQSTGPHLHLEVRVNGSPQNPRGYLP